MTGKQEGTELLLVCRRLLRAAHSMASGAADSLEGTLPEQGFSAKKNAGKSVVVRWFHATATLDRSERR